MEEVRITVTEALTEREFREKLIDLIDDVSLYQWDNKIGVPFDKSKYDTYEVNLKLSSRRLSDFWISYRHHMFHNETQALKARVSKLAEVERIRQSGINILDVNHHVRNALMRAGLISIGELVDALDRDPEMIQKHTRNFGMVSYWHVLEALREVGVPSREQLMSLVYELSDALEDCE